jgi:hypothetical protein
MITSRGPQPNRLCVYFRGDDGVNEAERMAELADKASDTKFPRGGFSLAFSFAFRRKA